MTNPAAPGAKKKTKKRKKRVKQPNRNERISEALDYARQGHGYEEIGAQMKIAPIEAQELVEAGLAQIIRNPEKTAALLELERINTLIPQVYENARGGDQAAIDLLLKLTQRKNILEQTVQEGMLDFLGSINRPKPKHRPPHQPTRDTIQRIQAWAFAGIDHETMAEWIGINSETMRKHYGAIIKNAVKSVVAEALDKTIQGMRAGEKSDRYFITKTRGFKATGEHWYENQPAAEARERGVPGGEPSEIIEITGGLLDPEPDPVAPTVEPTDPKEGVA